jgi:L-lactate dehydrogenase (cytochrome)
MSICSIEDMAEHTGRHPFWFQLYVMRDRDFIERLIDRAKAANCSALQLTLDLQILGQRHKDIKNGLSAPPKPTLANLINLATKPRWCLGMLGTKRRSFGNIVGHAKGVGDMSSLSSWTAEQFDPQLNWGDVEWIKKRWGGKLILKGIMDAEDARWPSTAVPMRSSSATTAAASSTARLPPLLRCLTLPKRWARTSRCGWTAASAAARTCSRPVRWARGTLIGRSFLYGLGAMARRA